MGSPTAVFHPLTISHPFFIPLCSTSCCIFTAIHAPLLPQALLCGHALSVHLSPHHSWIGRTQGSNKSTPRCLQEASFHRPSCFTVTMEISTTAVTHARTHRDVVLSTPQKPNAFILKNLDRTVCHHMTPQEQLGPQQTQQCLKGTTMPTIPFHPMQEYGHHLTK